MTEINKRTIWQHARLVCCHCAGYTPPYEPWVNGPNAAMNFFHRHRTTPEQTTLCRASALWLLLEWPHQDFPTVVCLCGSARFKETFEEADRRETMAGNVVLSICPNPVDLAKVAEVHRKKIDVADEILVINVDGYIGDSTRSEIEYARSRGKKVRFLESSGVPQG